MRLEEFIDRSNRTTSIDELIGLVHKAVQGFGIDHIDFTQMTGHAARNRTPGHDVPLSRSDDRMKCCVEQGFRYPDPVGHCMAVTDGCDERDSRTSCPELTNNQKMSFHEAAPDGLRISFGTCLPGVQGAHIVFGLADSAGSVDLDKNALSYLNLLAMQFYHVYLSLECPSNTNDAVRLTDREQEILKWCASGRTRCEIGVLLNISENTVDYHLRNIYRKLDTKNITVAVLTALRNGLMQL